MTDIFEDYIGELCPQEHKELMAELKKEKFYLSVIRPMPSIQNQNSQLISLRENLKRNCPKTLQRSGLRTYKNFHLIMYMAKKSDEPAYAPAETQKQVLSKVPP